LKDTEEKVSKSIFIMVPSLGPLFATEFYTLSGATGTHTENHYATNDTTSKIQGMAQDYFKNKSTAGIKIKINDMSLPWGGMFDICGTFNIVDTCTAALNGGHSWHRTGKSVDIEHAGVKELLLDEIAEQYDGVRHEVKKIHYEFP
jgi:hypothetical protein